MAVNDVTLSSSMRSNLLQLQNVNDKIAQKQQILATGNKVNTALDGPTAYFAAKSLSQRAGDLTALKDSMGQAISTIKAADKGMTSIDSMLDQAKGLTTAAYSALGNDASSVATRKALAQQFNALKTQIDKLAEDSGYGGKNLLTGNGQRLDSTSASRRAVNTITGLDNARVTNVSATDTYSVRVKGTGSITAQAADVTQAEQDRGLVGLKVSGKMSTTSGNFSDISIETRGSVGQPRTFIVSDGTESRTINYFDNNQTATATTTTAAKSTQAQVTNVAISGTIEAGDIFSISVEGQTFSYTATSADVTMTTTASAAIASKLQASITAALGANGRLSGTSYNLASATINAKGEIQLTGATAASQARPMTISANTTNALSKTVSESFASGAVVSFTIDRTALEKLANGGSGSSTLQKSVDLQISVTNLQGNTVTRDANNQRGEGKLDNGEQAFAFDSGTVRVNVDAKTIQQAAVSNSSANITTVQVANANTANDLTVQLNERNTNSITLAAQNLTTSGQGLQVDNAQNDWTDRADIDKAAAGLDNAKQKLRSASQTLSTNLNIVTTRESFTKEFSNVLTEGANKLTLADQNEEGAGLLMLQTRQQLGTIALSLANQSQQSILRLF